MRWLRVPPETRALAALAAGLLFFVPVSLLAVADDPSRPYQVAMIQIAVVGMFAGFLSSLACWQRFPGWDVFSAGCAFAVAGAFRGPVPSASWVHQALLLLPGAVAWYVSARATESSLVFPLGYDHRSAVDSGRLQEGLNRGGLPAALLALAVAVCLPAAFPTAPLIAFPLACAVGLALGLRVPGRPPLWSAMGALLGLPAAFLCARGLAVLLGMGAGPEANPWLVGGLLQAGATFGLWLARWRRRKP